MFEPTDDVGVAEVIETAIAARELFGAPTWATASSTIMESFVPPAGVRRLTIFADNDTSFAGQLAAFTLARRLCALDPGLAITVKVPPEPDSDWLDVLNGVGARSQPHHCQPVAIYCEGCDMPPSSFTRSGTGARDYLLIARPWIATYPGHDPENPL